ACAGSKAKTNDVLADDGLGDAELRGRFAPPDLPAPPPDSIRVIRAADRRWRLEPGRPGPVPLGLLASTEHLTVAVAELYAGQHGDWQTRGGDESGYLLDGVLGVRIGSGGGREFLELPPGDGWHGPKGTAHSYVGERGPGSFRWGVGRRFLGESAGPPAPASE